MTNTSYFDSPDEQEENKLELFKTTAFLQNYTSTNRHKFPWLNSTYTPLSIYSSNTGFKGPWRPLARSHKDPESYISSTVKARPSTAPRGPRWSTFLAAAAAAAAVAAVAWSPHQLRASICQASSMSSPICLPLRQQQGNVSTQPDAPHHTLRHSPETCCRSLKGLCRCISVNTGVLHWVHGGTRFGCDYLDWTWAQMWMFCTKMDEPHPHVLV